MDGWSITRAGVQGILLQVGTDVDELRAAVTQDTLSVVMEGLAWGGELTEPVSTAVDGVLVEQHENLGSIVGRATAGIVGVSNAALAYDAGQEEMAATFQTELFVSAETGDFTYFATHGYQG